MGINVHLGAIKLIEGFLSASTSQQGAEDAEAGNLSVLDPQVGLH